MKSISNLIARIRHPKDVLKAILLGLILAFTIPGSVLLGFSLGQEVTHVEGSSVSGRLALGRTPIVLDWPVESYAELAWTNPLCRIRFYFLTADEYQAYASSSMIVTAPTLTCDQPNSVFVGAATHAIAVNERGADANFTIQIDLFFASRPLAWLSLPALFLLAGATVCFVTWFFRSMVARELERISSEKKEKRR